MNNSYPNSSEYSEDPGRLFAGVILKKLTIHQDDRGALTEIFRESWGFGDQALQWNFVKSEANVMRGLHAHIKHSDYLTVLSGEMLLGLHDFRPNSSTYQESCFMRINCKDPHMINIPVGHGFYFDQPCLHINGVSKYFSPEDELGCLWNDELLNLNWPCKDPLLSERDKNAISYTQLLSLLSERATF
ncbi:MAG: dTDP-4-dehydrorhamnose 3,5-epimerase family protein [Gammaproteobacteria bacterium]|nr:dTDP-4-dehydrorhamnose 3,5-epimerase family protein [Gammaproteobacteria bacterium]